MIMVPKKWTIRVWMIHNAHVKATTFDKINMYILNILETNYTLCMFDLFFFMYVYTFLIS